jgi:hypothetical protein
VVLSHPLLLFCYESSCVLHFLDILSAFPVQRQDGCWKMPTATAAAAAAAAAAV